MPNKTPVSSDSVIVANDSQVRDRVPPAPPKRKLGNVTAQPSAVIDQDPRLSARAASARCEMVVDSDHAVRLAQELRDDDPSFTAEKLRARARGMKTLQVPALAPKVIRMRRTRWIALICAISAFASTIVTIVITRLVTGEWPWQLI